MASRRKKSNLRNPEEIQKQYITYLKAKELSESTIDAYTTSVKQYFLMHETITKENGISWKHELLAQGKKAKTVNVRLNAYNSLCEMLHQDECKCKAVKIHQATAISNVISDSDYKKLLRCLANDQNLKWYYGIKLLAVTGARVSEYVCLQKKDFDRGYAELWTKGKIRRIYIPKSYRDEAASYYASLSPDDYLMTNRFGKKMTTRGVATMLQKFSLKYDIDSRCMHPHSFRHFFAIEFLERNSNLSLLADLMGHSSVSTTAIYTRMTKEQQRLAVDAAVCW